MVLSEPKESGTNHAIQRNVPPPDQVDRSDKEEVKQGTEVVNVDVGDCIRLFVAGTCGDIESVVCHLRANSATVSDVWTPSMGYSFLVVHLPQGSSLADLVPRQDKATSVRLALDQNNDREYHYAQPLAPLGWICPRKGCHSCNDQGTEWCGCCDARFEPNWCRAGMTGVTGVITRIFNKTRTGLFLSC